VVKTKKVVKTFFVFLSLYKNKNMTTLSLPHTFAISILSRLLRRKSKSVKSVRSVKTASVKNYETFNEIKGDVMDYDGMGNYGRFPCAK
jgi:hypothetical protein